MSIKTTLVSAANTAFTVLDSLVKSGTYKAVDDTGFTETVSEYPVRIIFDSFSERDVQTLKLAKLVQPTDVKGLVLGSVMPVEKVRTTDIIIVDDSEYSVVSYDVDPAGAMYTLLLRRLA